MELPQLTDNLNTIQSLADKPALTAAELKAAFDLNSNTIKTYINSTLIPQLNTVLTNLQNGDTSLQTAINSVSAIANQAATDITTINSNITTINSTLAGLKSGATTKVTIGANVPSSLENGEVYFQYFS